MAKKVIISDLVVQVGADTSKAVKGLKALDDKLKGLRKTKSTTLSPQEKKARDKLTKDTEKFIKQSKRLGEIRAKNAKVAARLEKDMLAAARANNAEKLKDIRESVRSKLAEVNAEIKAKEKLKRLSEDERARELEKRARIAQIKADNLAISRAKEYIKRSREIYRLKKRDYKLASHYEKEILEGTKARDKLRVAAAKRDVGLRLEEFRQADVAARKAEVARNNAARDQRIMADKKERERRRENTHYQVLQRRRMHFEEKIAKSRLKALKQAANISTGSGVAAPVAVGGAAAAVGGGMLISRAHQEGLQLRMSEQQLRASLTRSMGDAYNEQAFSDIRERLYNSSAYFGANPLEALSSFGRLRATITPENVGNEQLMQYTQGISALTAVAGVGAEDLKRFNHAFSQVMSGSLDSKDLQEMTGAIPTIAPLIADALGITQKELNRQAKAGELTQHDPVELFNNLTRLLNEEFLAVYDRDIKGKYADTTNKLFNVAIPLAWQHFFTGFEEQLKTSMKSITSFLTGNTELFKSLGKGMAVVLEVVARLAQVLLEKFKPTLEEIVKWGEKADNIKADKINEIADSIINIGKAIAGLYAMGSTIKALLLFFGAIAAFRSLVGLSKDAKYLLDIGKAIKESVSRGGGKDYTRKGNRGATTRKMPSGFETGKDFADGFRKGSKPDKLGKSLGSQIGQTLLKSVGFLLTAKGALIALLVGAVAVANEQVKKIEANSTSVAGKSHKGSDNTLAVMTSNNVERERLKAEAEKRAEEVRLFHERMKEQFNTSTPSILTNPHHFNPVLGAINSNSQPPVQVTNKFYGDVTPQVVENAERRALRFGGQANVGSE